MRAVERRRGILILKCIFELEHPGEYLLLHGLIHNYSLLRSLLPLLLDSLDKLLHCDLAILYQLFSDLMRVFLFLQPALVVDRVFCRALCRQAMLVLGWPEPQVSCLMAGAVPLRA